MITVGVAYQQPAADYQVQPLFLAVMTIVFSPTLVSDNRGVDHNVPRIPAARRYDVLFNAIPFHIDVRMLIYVMYSTHCRCCKTKHWFSCSIGE